MNSELKILFDIGHPAHIHYFKNPINIMKKRGGEITIVARDKEVTHTLLTELGLDYISRGRGGNSLFEKLLYLFYGVYKLYRVGKITNTDLFVSFGSTYAAQASFLLGKRHIAFEDSENAHLEHLLYIPFTSVVHTPYTFKKSFGTKQKYYDGYIELAYLSPKYFKPKKTIYQQLGINESENYAVIRLISWAASHDVGQKGFREEDLLSLINHLKGYVNHVFISSEGSVPKMLRENRPNIRASMIHELLYYSDIYIGEGATMAIESALLGTPAIYVNSLTGGVVEELEHEYGLLFRRQTYIDIIGSLENIFNKPPQTFNSARERLLSEKPDMCNYIVGVLDND